MHSDCCLHVARDKKTTEKRTFSFGGWETFHRSLQSAAAKDVHNRKSDVLRNNFYRVKLRTKYNNYRILQPSEGSKILSRPQTFCMCRWIRRRKHTYNACSLYDVQFCWKYDRQDIFASDLKLINKRQMHAGWHYNIVLSAPIFLTITNLGECFIRTFQFSLENTWLDNTNFYLPRRRSRFWHVPSFSFLIRRLKNLEWTCEGIVNAHHSTSIVKLATVVGCRKYGYKLTLCKEFITIFHNL